MTKENSFKSLFERTDQVLSKRAWHWGACHTLNEGVPFSLRCGPSYAEKLGKYFIFLARQVGELQPPYTFFEFGAGTGFLSRHLIRYLKKHDPELFQESHFYITEAFDASVEALKKDPELSHHPNITLAKYDVTTPWPAEWPQVSFAYSVYLLDALDAKRYFVENTRLFEVQYQTVIPDQVVLNTAVFPPQVLTPKDVQAYLENRTPESIKLTPQLQEFIKTKTHLMPVEKLENEDTFLDSRNAFIRAHASQSTYFFHDSEAITMHIQTVLDQLEEGGAYLVSDFGQHTTIGAEIEQALEAKYGTTRYFAVCFPLHQSRLPKDVTSWITSRSLDQTQEWLLYRGKHGDLVTGKARTHLEAMGDQAISKVLDTFMHFQPDDSEYRAKLQGLLETLSETDKLDYFLLQSLATQCIHDQLHQEAMGFIKTLAKEYGPLALHAYQLKGALYQMTGHYHEALHTYKEAVLLCQNNTSSLTGAAVCLAMIGQSDRAIELFIQALKQSAGERYWENFMFFIQLLLKMQKKETVKSALAWYPEMRVTYPELIPERVDTFLKSIPL